jgi:predicted AlkP superfamily pyrophosphatase or phosphodiesterase
MTRGRRLEVFVLIDALGWHYAQGLDFLADRLPYRGPLRTVLGYSSAAIPTLLTGKPPAEHGHWNLFYYDPEGSPFRWLRHFRVLPDTLLDNRLGRKALKELGRRALGLGPLFECCVRPRLLPWFNYVEQRNIYEPGGIAGAPSIFDRLAQAGVASRVYTYHRFTDAEGLRQARRDIAAGAADFYFVYLSELDAFLHLRCQDTVQVASRVAWYATTLRDLHDTAVRRDPTAGFTVLSDHGMTPVQHQHDLARHIEALGLRLPEDYLVVYDSTMARFWFFTDRARRRISDRLGQAYCGRILPEPELEALGLGFPDRRYGDLVFLLHPGWLLANSDFHGRGWQPAGMHGYHPDDPYSDAVFLSNRDPGVPLRTLADAHTFMLAAAGLDEQPMEASTT